MLAVLPTAQAASEETLELIEAWARAGGLASDLGPAPAGDVA